MGQVLKHAIHKRGPSSGKKKIKIKIYGKALNIISHQGNVKRKPLHTHQMTTMKGQN